MTGVVLSLVFLVPGHDIREVLPEAVGKTHDAKTRTTGWRFLRPSKYRFLVVGWRQDGAMEKGRRAALD